MPGLFDLLTTAMGRAPPSMQLAQGMGQAPGQPGSPAGPNPLAPPPGGPGGAPPAGGAPGAPGGPPQQQQGQQQQPPQPQVYQSPPDLGQMYLQLAQRSQAEQSFNNGIAGLVASIYPGRTSGALMSSLRGNVQDPSEVFGSLMKLQMFNQQQQLFGQQIARYNDLVGNSDQYAKSFGVDPTMFKATITAAGPQGVGDVLGKIAEAQMGITGTQTDKEYRQAVRNFQTANPDQPLPPELQSEAAFVQKQGAAVTMADTKAKDLAADQANFAPAKNAYDREIADVNWLIAPEQQAAMKENVGMLQQAVPYNALSSAGQEWYRRYKQVMASQYSSGVQDFKGAGRITQRELEQDLPSQSTMNTLNQTPDVFVTGAQKYLDKLQTNRAQLFGKAGQLNSPDLSDADYAKVNEIYKPGEGDQPAGSLYVAGQTPRRAAAPTQPAAPAVSAGPGSQQPVTVQTPADVAKLKSGTPFVIPAGPNKGKIGYAP